MKRILLWSCVLVACSSSGGSLFDPGGGNSNPFGGNITTGADGPCETREDKAGCACASDGQSRECWPGITGQSHAGYCKPGTQVCSTMGSKEFVSRVWGDCTGYTLPAGGCGTTSDGNAGSGNTSDGKGGGGNTSDGNAGSGNTSDGNAGSGNGGHGNTSDGNGGRGGRTNDGFGGFGFGGFGTGFGGNTSDGQGGRGNGGNGNTSDGNGGRGGRTNDGQGGGSTEDAPCGCPGQVRWCDDPVFCHWGNQTCLPDGNWGPCQEIKGGAPAGCEAGPFSGRCCEQQGLCCAWNNTRLVGTCQAGGCP